MTGEALWTADELTAATGGRFEGTPPREFSGVSIDSRTVSPGDVFVAIRGERLDGHEFAAAALRNGAGLAVVSRADDAMRQAGALLVVDDTLEALRGMARAARARSAARVIGVTGSVGKTGTKEALRLALAASGPTHASSSSFNNHWGVPLSLARLPRSARYALFEIGMNHAGEITPLTRMVKPHIAIITTIAPSHIGNFSSLAGIADAKAEIFLGVPPDGFAILNRDNEFFGHLSDAARRAGIKHVTSFGAEGPADAQLLRSALHAECSCVTARIFGEEVMYKLGAPGAHMVANSLAVLAAVHLAGADLARAAVAMGELRPPKGRGERHRLALPGGGAITLIDESYNANPASVEAALALLQQTEPGEGGRRIAVLGDMLELGDDGPALHAGLAGALDGSGCDSLYACGPLMRQLWDSAPARMRVLHAAASDELIAPLLNDLRAGDVVMIKGSLGSRMGPVVEALKKQFAATRG